jgi:hypothetical protein
LDENIFIPQFNGWEYLKVKALAKNTNRQNQLMQLALANAREFFIEKARKQWIDFSNRELKKDLINVIYLKYMKKKATNKTDIIFHLGYGKCASSTLQESVFPLTRGYLGAGKNSLTKHRFAKKFQAFSPCGPKITGNLKESKKWANQVIKFKQEEYSDVDRLIISDEFLIMNNFFKNRPIIPFLKKFDDTIWNHGEIKILIIIRNQADKLASGYAQSSIINPKASQADFERFIKSRLKDYFENMNYSKCIEELYKNFGKKKVCVLLMEDISDIHFWEKLKIFADLTEFNPQSMFNESQVNKRRLSKNTWQLREYNKDIRSKYKVNNYFKFFWPAYLATNQRQKVKNKAIVLLSKLYGRNKNKLSETETDIFLSDNVKNTVKEYYQESNQKLGKLLKRDLSKLGYL